MRHKQLLPIPFKKDLIVIVTKGYSIFPRSPERKMPFRGRVLLLAANAVS